MTLGHHRPVLVVALSIFCLASREAGAQAPTIVSVNPSAGPIGGGTSVTITGTNFTSDATVLFGGTAATVVGVSADGQQLSVTTPPQAPGAVDVVVTTGFGLATLSAAFTYVVPGPVPAAITAINPTAGSTAGGTQITITGSGFVNGATVQIGSQATNVVVSADGTTITAVTPASDAGTVDVVVFNPGEEPQVLPSAFTYTAICTSVVTTNCLSSFTVDGSSTLPSGLTAKVTLQGTTGVQVSLLNTNKSGSDQFDLDPLLSTSSVIALTVNVAPTFTPLVALATGLIQSWQFDAATDQASITFTPQSAAWNGTGGNQCVPDNCPAPADERFKAMGLISFDTLASADAAFQQAMNGGFIGTNAQYFSTFSYDSTPDPDTGKGTIFFDVGAPSTFVDVFDEDGDGDTTDLVASGGGPARAGSRRLHHELLGGGSVDDYVGNYEVHDRRLEYPGEHQRQQQSQRCRQDFRSGQPARVRVLRAGGQDYC